MSTIYKEKFLFLETLYQFFLDSGLSAQLANIVVFILALTILSLLIWLINLIGSKIISRAIRSAVRHTESKWDESLFKRKFYSRLVRFCTAIVVMATASILFQGFSARLLLFTDTILSIYLIYTGLQLFNSFLNTFNDVYESKPQAGRKPIRNLIQSISIIAGVIAAVLIISLILQQNPKQLLVAIGASAAIFSLVFRDVILGFVASIQITSQEMLRPGDWIQMPSKGADGIVKEINVLNVKVQNRDNSISMIPSYALLSEAFINWQNMFESAGRLFKRPLLVDIHCVHILSQEQIDIILNNPLFPSHIQEKTKELMSGSNHSAFITNLGLYRCYIEAILQSHPLIVEDQIKVVRYLDNSESGITIQLYAYSKEKTLYEYERIISDIFENIIAVAPLFHIRMFQRTTDYNSTYIKGGITEEKRNQKNT